MTDLCLVIPSVINKNTFKNKKQLCIFIISKQSFFKSSVYCKIFFF